MTILAGAAIFVAAPILLACFIRFGADKHLCARATISDTLHDLMKRVTLSDDTTISIVGGRCANIDDDKYPWMKRLRAWLSSGATIRYLLIEPTQASKAKLELLRSDFPDKFTPFYIDDVAAIEDNEIRRLMEESRTTHFTLFNNPKLIWLEGNHPNGSKTAFNCEFVDEKRAERDRRYDGLAQLFSRFCEEASSPAKAFAVA